MTEDKTRCQQVIALIDQANSADPNMDEGQPKELLYSQRMSAMLQRFSSDADEVAQLAVRAQHPALGGAA